MTVATATSSISNKIRDGLETTLKADLPAMLTAMNLAGIREWNKYHRISVYVDATMLPCIGMELDSFTQPEDSFSAAGTDAVGSRIYRFGVWVVIKARNEEEAEKQLAAYVDAVAAVLDDATNRTLGLERVMSTWPEEAFFGESIPVESDTLKAARLTVAVDYCQEIGEYTTS